MLVTALLRSNRNRVCQVGWLTACWVLNMLLGIDGCQERYEHQRKTLPCKRHPRLQIRFKRNINGLAGPEISYTNVTPMLKWFANCNANGNPGLKKSIKKVLQMDRQPNSPPANPASSTQPAQPSQPNPSTQHPASRPPKHDKFSQIVCLSPRAWNHRK